MKDTPLLEAPAGHVAIPPRGETRENPSTPNGGDSAPSSDLALVARYAADPNVDVAKLERLIAMQERMAAHFAKSAFDAAFSVMQSELPEITERGQILVKGQLRSTYAKLEDIQAQIKPVLQKHGFAIRHRTEWPDDKKGIIRIVGILSHRDGHSEESSFEAPMDKSEYRTDIQSMGSTVSYGRRYTTLDVLNITTRGQDDDGSRAATGHAAVDQPPGYVDWLVDLTAVAEEGEGKLKDAWNASKPIFRNYITKNEPMKWAALKSKALQAGGAR